MSCAIFSALHLDKAKESCKAQKETQYSWKDYEIFSYQIRSTLLPGDYCQENNKDFIRGSQSAHANLVLTVLTK